jgi:uncharacterized protein (DUF1015 family)
LAEFIPFHGFFFNPEGSDLKNSIVRLERFVSAIDNPDEKNLLIELLKKVSDIKDSDRIFKKWLREGVMMRTENPHFFLHRERFYHRGKEYERYGIIAAMKVVPFEEGVIFPHEHTFYEGTQLYLDFMLRIGKNFEQVFVLYEDPSLLFSNLNVKNREPLLEVKDELDCLHTLWTIEDPEFPKVLNRIIGSQSLVIADGHHRYEASILYRNLMREKYPHMRDAPFNYRLVNLINVYDSGVIILPTHRIYLGEVSGDFDMVLSKLKEKFDLQRVPLSNFIPLLEKRGKGYIGFYRGGEMGYIIHLKDQDFLDEVLPDQPTEYKNLDVVVLHEGLLKRFFRINEENLGYMRDAEEAVGMVRRGEATWTFLLNPPEPFQVKKIAEMGLRMPAKSTDFYPKLVAGLIFYDLLPKT